MRIGYLVEQQFSSNRIIELDLTTMKTTTLVETGMGETDLRPHWDSTDKAVLYQRGGALWRVTPGRAPAKLLDLGDAS